MEETIYTPFLNCGWKSSEDGCCSHPSNATPECHKFICPIKAAQPSVQRTGEEAALCNCSWHLYGGKHEESCPARR
jgi:hypothetical protein